jgi:hypothetical protein
MSAVNSRQLRKLVNAVEGAGGWFRKQDERSFMEIDLPDSLAQHETTIRDNYDAIFGMLFPPKRSSRKKRNVCSICRSGAGCRRRQAVKAYQNCGLCGHWCVSHFREEIAYGGATTPGGCMKQIGSNSSDLVRCVCPGWPIAPEHKKISKQENVMPLFTNEELRESHERYLQKQTQDTERPRSKREILIEICTAHPGVYTTKELAEGSGMSPSWIRRTLKAAGLKPAPARRRRNSESGEESR